MMARGRRALRRHSVFLILRVWPLTRLWYRAWGLALDGRPDDRVWYFAYGANMHNSVFVERRKMQPRAWRIARIQGYRLRFNLEGRPKGRAAPANICCAPGAEVWGVLYDISRRELVRLNATEGVPGGRYRPFIVVAVDRHGADVEALTYMADGMAVDGNPSLRYITLLREGARDSGLPAEWIAFLDGVKTAD